MHPFRILNDPAGSGGGAPDVVEPPADSSGDLVTISRAELETLRSRAAGGLSSDRAEFESLLRAREAAYDRELAAREQRAAEMERAYKAALRDRELATALAGRPLIPGAATQLVKLWRDDFEVHAEGGEYRVATRDGRPVGQAVAAWLSSPEYAHFCPPPTRGGTATRAIHRPVADGPAAPAPRTLGESIVAAWQQAQTSSRPEVGSTPVGLGRRR